MFVRNAIPSITLMISPTFDELSEMFVIVSTTRPIASPPALAIEEACSASEEASFALVVVRRTVPVSSSMLAAVCCSEAACSSVRCDKFRLPAAICALVEATPSALRRTRLTTSAKFACISRSAASSSPISSDLSGRISVDRSPVATVRATSTARTSGCVMVRLNAIAPPSPATSATSMSERLIIEARWASPLGLVS
jgi:hypothetical protein